jgi:hypothetical protein
MDSSDASNVYITGLDEATTYTFFGYEKSAGISENSADASATTVQNIPDSPDISLNDVSFTSMTVHMETVYADKNVTVSTFPGFRMTVPWIVRFQNVTSRIGRSYKYTFFGWAKNSQESAKLGGRQCNHNTEYTRFSRYFAQRRVLTSMTVHMETVYAADKNVGFRRFLDSA